MVKTAAVNGHGVGFIDGCCAHVYVIFEHILSTVPILETNIVLSNVSVHSVDILSSRTGRVGGVDAKQVKRPLANNSAVVFIVERQISAQVIANRLACLLFQPILNVLRELEVIAGLRQAGSGLLKLIATAVDYSAVGGAAGVGYNVRRSDGDGVVCDVRLSVAIYAVQANFERSYVAVAENIFGN